jgi:phosphatidylserine/phosphatidylglycerophosphate/cardiolipin synthase-like enzyme
MRGLYILVLLALVLPTAQPGPSSSLELDAGVNLEQAVAEQVSEMLITEVCPGRPVEYVIITNHGEERPLGSMTVDDGEGNITILANITLGRAESLAIVADGDMFSDLRPGIPYIEKGNASLKWSGKFALADGGDEAILRSIDRAVIDVVAYGSSLYSGEGWQGPVLGTVPKGHALFRGAIDSNSSADWSVEPPGRSDHIQHTFRAVVEPFSAPETAAGRIAREISMASRTVNCSVYEISDPFVIDQLVRCAGRGLRVNVLIEGQPVGGLSDRSLDGVATLTAAGVGVREMRSIDSYKRYDYMHAKYMVVDSRRVTLMSENWGSGLYANRGWGVTMDGVEIGTYFDRVFDGDYNGPLDAQVPRAAGDILGGSEQPDAPDELLRYRCEVTTILSPDHSIGSLKGFIDNAMDTILVEQLSVDPDWLEGPSLLASLIGAAERGVKVRLLLDSSWDREDNQAVADKLNALAAAEGYDLKAQVISPYHGLAVMHNKGLVIDDLAIISSINWGDSALCENREAGAAVRSEQIAAYFSELFWADWAVDPIPPVVVLPWTHIEVPEGRPVLLDASNSSDNAHYLEVEWDIDGDGSVDSNATTWAVKLPAGNHAIVLILRDRGNNTVTATCQVSVLPAGGATVPMATAVLLALPAVVVTMIIVWKKVFRRSP